MFDNPESQKSKWRQAGDALRAKYERIANNGMDGLIASIPVNLFILPMISIAQREVITTKVSDPETSLALSIIATAAEYVIANFIIYYAASEDID
jgi:hypothetical protein